jgi:hypothetical protein
MWPLKFNALCMAINLLLFVGCSQLPKSAKGPLVDTCISDPEAFGFHCVDKEEKPYFVHYAKTQGFVCYPKEDHKLILDWINSHLKKVIKLEEGLGTLIKTQGENGK